MNEADFLAQAEQSLIAIEDAVDEAIENSDAALDYENNGAVLTIECEDTRSQVIVSRQLAMQQLWVAAKSGGFHCDWQSEQWFCRNTEETLPQLLNRVLSEQSDNVVELVW